MNILGRLTFGTAAIAGLAACEHGDPVSNAGGPEGAAQLFAASPSGATLPAGTLTFGSVTFFGVDPTVRDLFNRMPPTGIGQRGRYFRTAANQLYWRWPADIFRNASAAIKDPRFPVITSTTSVVAATIWDLYQPSGPYPGDNYWESYSEIDGLTPSTVHEVAFVQYRTVVKGQLDQTELFLTGSVSEPDSLFLSPGTIAKINTDWTGAPGGAGCDPFPGANTNPFIFSQDPTDNTGYLFFDKCWVPNGILWTAAEFGTQSKSMVGRNDDVAYSLPNYNYVEVWEGAYGTGRPVLRAQIAQDLNASGAPLANGFAPFPAPKTVTTFSGQTAPATVDQVASFPLTQTSLLLSLAGTILTPVDNLTFTISNLQKLATGAYRTWFINPNTGIAVPAKGTYTRTVGTTVVENTPNVSAFTGGEGTIKFVTDPYLAQIAPKTTNDSLSFFLVSVEADANVAQPSLAQSLWFRIFKIPPASVGGSVFGNFNVLAAGDTAPPLRFTPQGSMSGGVIGDTALVLVDSAGITLRKSQFVGSVVEVRYTGLQRPPVGYRYEGVLVGKADTTVKVSAGGLLGPNAESLDNADTDPVSANLTRNMIFFGRLVFNVATGEPAGDTICDYGRFRLYLVPKNRTEKFLTLIFDSPLPARVTGAASCR